MKDQTRNLNPTANRAPSRKGLDVRRALQIGSLEMTIHAGPYIQRTIRDKLRWAHQFRIDADAAEAKASDLRRAALQVEEEAARMAAGTDFFQQKP